MLYSEMCSKVLQLIANALLAFTGVVFQYY